MWSGSFTVCIRLERKPLQPWSTSSTSAAHIRAKRLHPQNRHTSCHVGWCPAKGQNHLTYVHGVTVHMNSHGVIHKETEQKAIKEIEATAVQYLGKLLISPQRFISIMSFFLYAYMLRMLHVMCITYKTKSYTQRTWSSLYILKFNVKRLYFG